MIVMGVGGGRGKGRLGEVTRVLNLSQMCGKCEDRVGWNREKYLSFHPADPMILRGHVKEVFFRF